MVVRGTYQKRLKFGRGRILFLFVLLEIFSNEKMEDDKRNNSDCADELDAIEKFIETDHRLVVQVRTLYTPVL